MDNYSDWIQIDYFWVDPSQPWDVVWYGMVTDNKFDLIFNTCDKIYRDKDKSEWAYKALEECAALLSYEVRWPYFMNHDKDPKTRIGWRLRRLAHWLYLVGPVHVYGHSKRMSRDPYTAFYTLCEFLDRTHHIKNIKPPRYLYRPGFWIWRSRLIKDNRKEYQKRLDALKGAATAMNYNRNELKI